MAEQALGQTGWRRRAWLGGAAGVATLAGVGVALWEQERGNAASPLPGFWTQQWPTPAGGTLSMESLKGRPLLVNFWATWCAPCVEELPLINAFYREHRANGWQVLALAVDQLAPVQKFLQTMPLDFSVGLAGSVGAEWARSLGNLAGGLPFSVVLDSQGTIVQRKIGRLMPADLAAWSGIK
ncbi:MAG: TlpA disulfide reductase family protein [Rhodoferax sp.]|nr:TlpA disulfide reductase family protein [Rhodoferax sp.]